MNLSGIPHFAARCQSPNSCASSPQRLRRIARLSMQCAAGAAVACLLAPLAAHAGPSGGQIQKGEGSITASGSSTIIKQASARLAIDWQAFSSKAGESIVFEQPGPASIALNRIVGTGASGLAGTLTANGQVFILNPNGVLFAPGATVNAQGLLASTLDMNVNDFMLGKQDHLLQGAGRASVINQGTLTAASGGYMALVGPTVINDGTLSATRGDVLMAGGGRVRVTLNAGSLLGYAIEQGGRDALAHNTASGRISANGGRVSMQVAAADLLSRAVVNQAGIVEAQTLEGEQASLEGQPGSVRLLADAAVGRIEMSGRVDVRAVGKGAAGSVETSAAEVRVMNGAKTFRSAQQGNAGKWTINAGNFSIVEEDAGQTLSGIGNRTLEADLAANAGASLTIAASTALPNRSGNVVVQAPLAWQNAALTLSAQRDILVNADLNVRDKAGLMLKTGQMENGSGAYFFGNARINLANSASFATVEGLNGMVKNYTIIRELGTESNAPAATLQGMLANGHYVLGADIDASATGKWNLVGNALAGGFTPHANFNGTLDGLGHQISGLHINRPDVAQAGLFASTGKSAVIRHLGVIDADITAGRDVGIVAGINQGGISHTHSSGKVAGVINVAGLAGQNQGRIDYASSSAQVEGVQTIGGLVGFNEKPRNDTDAERAGLISNSHATGRVIIQPNRNGAPYRGRNIWAGGLAGFNSAGIIRTSYATGEVNGTESVGGLVGRNSGLVENSYAVGKVTGNKGVGGLAGYAPSETFPGVFINTYASGEVGGTDPATTGGLIGLQGDTAVVLASYWNSDPVSKGGTGIADVGDSRRGQGLSGAQLMQINTYASDWNISKLGGSNAVWRIYEGITMPLLRPFLADLSLPDASLAYNGATQAGMSVAQAPGRAMVAASGRNAGVYVPYSGQNGYDISGGELRITPAPLTVSASNVIKMYDGTVSAPGAAAIVVGGTLHEGDRLSGGSFAFDDRNAGIGGKTVNLSGVTVNDGNGGGNYVLTLSPSAGSTITPALLTVAANSDGKRYDRIPYKGGNGVIYAGLVSGDNAETLGGQLGYGGSAQGAVAAGSYRITPGGLESRNYAITYLDGTLQIDPPRDLSAAFGLLNPLPPSAPPGSLREVPEPGLAGCGILLPETLVPVDCAPAVMPARR